MYKFGDIIVGEYAVSHVFTNGGMGVVYKVRRSGWDFDMAMKCPRAELFENDAQRKGFVKECETWMNLGSHPNIISCYYIKTIDSVPSVFMEYADGGSLLDCITSGRLYKGSPSDALRRILDYAIQTARGLFQAHQKGYVHQDVKPANVLLTSSGVAKVSDFGLSKAKNNLRRSALESDGRSLVVSSGGWTPAYGSPEQALGHPLTRCTDIWSWALMILEMIHGDLFWKAGPFAARELKKLWPWQIFSPKVKSSRELVKILRYCLEEREDKRPKDFDVVEAELLSLYKDTFSEEYQRKLPSDIITAEATLCNRIASYAELEGDDTNYLREVYDIVSEFRTVSPFAIWGDVNYAVYRLNRGFSVDKTIRIIENQLRRANTDKQKEWLLDILLSLGLNSVRDPAIKLLRIENNKRLVGKIQRMHESMRDRLKDVFADETIRRFEQTHIDLDGQDRLCATSESGNVRVTAIKEVTDTMDCNLSVIVTLSSKNYEFKKNYLPRESRLMYVTADDRGVKISVWIWISSRGFFQKVFGLENGRQISYRCDYSSPDNFGCGIGDVPLGVYVSGDARLLMLRYRGNICSVWQNDRCDDGDGRNICVVDLNDYGMIPPETILPKLRLERGFEYGISDDTAYRLMRTLAHVYGRMRIPCYIMRPESSDVEFDRSRECSSLLEQANVALQKKALDHLNDTLVQCIRKGVLPDKELLNVHHAAVKTNKAHPVIGWHSDTLDNTLLNPRPICNLISIEENSFQVLSYDCTPQFISLSGSGHIFNFHHWGLDPSGQLISRLKEPGFAALCTCDNGDVIVACFAWINLHSICRVSKDVHNSQVIVWEWMSPRGVLRSDVLNSHQTKQTISFELRDEKKIVFLNKADGVERSFDADGLHPFWFDDFDAESPLSLLIVSESKITALDRHGKASPLLENLKRLSRLGSMRGISSDGRKLLTEGTWELFACDLLTMDSKVIYAIDPSESNEYGFNRSSPVCCALSSCGRSVAILTVDCRVKIFDVQNQHEIFEWMLDSRDGGPLQFDKSGRWLTLIRNEKQIEVFQTFWEYSEKNHEH